MKKLITVTAILILLSIVNCGAGSLEKDSDVLVPLLQGSSSKSAANKQMDVNDLEGCQILISQKWDGYESKFGAGTDQTWLKGNGWLSERGISLDSAKIDKSYKIGEMADKNERFSHQDSRLVYVGPWQYIKKIDRKIRLFSIQENDPKEKAGVIRNFYESLDPQNQKIPEMPLKLLKPAYGDEFCILKWHIKYGYNAIAETKKVYREGVLGFFDRIFQVYIRVPTGKIIEAKE